MTKKSRGAPRLRPRRIVAPPKPVAADAPAIEAPAEPATCITCRFFWRGHLSGLICRRFPPGAAVGAAALWPQVRASDWCGEHQAAG